MLLDGLVLVGGQLSGLAQDRVRDADLADVVEQARRRGSSRRAPSSSAEPLGEEHAVAGDVLGVALRVAVLACRPRGPGPGRRRSVAPSPAGASRRAGDADGVAAARLGLLERRPPPSRGARSPTRRARGTWQMPALTVIGSRSDRLELEAVRRAAPSASELDDVSSVVRRRSAVATTRNSSGPYRPHACRRAASRRSSSATVEQHVVARPVAVGVVEQPEVVDVDERDADGRARPRGRSIVAARCVDERAVVERPGQRVAPGRVDQRRRLAVDPRCADRKTRNSTAARSARR